MSIIARCCADCVINTRDQDFEPLRTPPPTARFGTAVFARDEHEAWPVKADLRSFTLEHTEQPVVVAFRAVNTHFVEAVHIAMHCLPLPTATECRWWCVGDSLHDGGEFRSHRSRTAIEKVVCRHGLQ